METCLIKIKLHLIINIKALTFVSIYFIEVHNPLSRTQEDEKETECCNQIFLMAPLCNIYNLNILNRVSKCKKKFIRNEIAN